MMIQLEPPAGLPSTVAARRLAETRDQEVMGRRPRACTSQYALFAIICTGRTRHIIGAVRGMR
jgi:hypothetical protein